MKRILLMLVCLAILVQPLTAHAAILSGAVTEWRNGREYPAVGVRIIIGVGINLVSGSGGQDIVTGASGVIGSWLTDSQGRFAVDIPNREYTVIGWKAGYIPQVYTRVTPGKYLPVSCSVDNQPGAGGRHQYLTYRNP